MPRFGKSLLQINNYLYNYKKILTFPKNVDLLTKIYEKDLLNKLKKN